MKLKINGQDQELEVGTVAEALNALKIQTSYIAVAVNLTFVPKEKYASRALREDDAIEIVAPSAGG